MTTDKPRYSITVSEKMLQEIEDYRFGNRIPTRAQATIQLIELGLKALREQSKQDKN